MGGQFFSFKKLVVTLKISLTENILAIFVFFLLTLNKKNLVVGFQARNYMQSFRVSDHRLISGVFIERGRSEGMWLKIKKKSLKFKLHFIYNIKHNLEFSIEREIK